LSVLFGLGFGFFVMMLWNGLVPDIWGWKEITYWQGAGLVILTRLLFGSHGYHKGINQPQAGCHANSSQQRAECVARNGDTYYEQWWEEEGEVSLEKYTKKMLEKESSYQDSGK
jgi:hypothetical protein